jgi:hypothetical protein
MARCRSRVPTCCGLAALVLAVVLLGPDPAAAQGMRPRYEVTGFREAHFGMTEFEVRQIARRSFGVGDAQMTQTKDPVTGTTKLIVHVLNLEPGLGEGRVEYTFGYEQHKLYRVDVIWGLDTNPLLSNFPLLAGALRLQRYFLLGYTWAMRSVQTGILLNERAILLFSGVDDRDRSVTVVIQDLLYEQIDLNLRLVPELAVPTRVTVTYLSEGSVDIDRITRNEF